MTMKRVHFFGMDEEGDQETELGSITWDGTNFAVQVGPHGTPLQMKRMLEYPLFLHDENGTTYVYSEDDPERFIDNLYLHYKSWALRATKPEIVD